MIKQRKHAKEMARKNCLIGVEKAPNMFMLAYANMNFHGDGSSRLYNLDSLVSSVSDDNQTFGSELCSLYDKKMKNYIISCMKIFCLVFRNLLKSLMEITKNVLKIL